MKVVTVQGDGTLAHCLIECALKTEECEALEQIVKEVLLETGEVTVGVGTRNVAKKVELCICEDDADSGAVTYKVKGE